MNSGTQLQLSFGELLTVLGVVMGGFVWLAQLLVAQVKRSLHAELTGLRETCTELRAEVDLLNRQLPLEYVRREDWIRFSTSIDAKLDRQGERLSEVLARMPAMGGVA